MTGSSPSGSAFVLLGAGHRRVALRADVVAELAPPVKLHAFPHSSNSITGVIIRRGRIVPVYQVDSVFGRKSSSAQRFYLIARRRIGKALELGAIPVNGECELVSADLQPPAAEQPAYVTGTITIGDESLDVLDLGALIESNSPVAGSSNPAEVQS